MTRRCFLALLGQSLAACSTPVGPNTGNRGRVDVRVRTPMSTIQPGEHPLGLASGRDGLLYVPRTYNVQTPAPLAVMLHGAGGSGAAMRFTYDEADAQGIIVLAPDSRNARTWDVILRDFGPDVEFLERALDHTFERCNVDARRLAIGGFSDGASYALSVGLGNGELFTDICAFSPGFVAPAARRGKPAVFISHGVADEVLPIAQTSRRIVPDLRKAGYEVTYREFEGGHEVPRALLREGLQAVAS